MDAAILGDKLPEGGHPKASPRPTHPPPFALPALRERESAYRAGML